MADADTQAWGPVGARLRAPASTWDLSAFLDGLHARHLRLRLPGLGALAADPGLPGRIRGAFGALLADAASPEAAAGQPCPWSPPCAFEALFRRQGRMRPGLEFPAPWILAVDPGRHGDLRVTLGLFGFATEWMPAAAEILTLALGRHVDWAGATGLFLPAPVLAHRHLIALDGLPRGGIAPQALELVFATPVVSGGAGALADPAAVFTNFGHRLEGIARWHDATLEGTDWRTIAAMVRDLRFTWVDAESLAWTRGSRRQDRRVPMRGVLGRLMVDGTRETLAGLMPLFLLGERISVGADIAFGCGRFQLTCFP